MGDDRTLLVSEFFHSLQGEGTRTGLPCAFVRLTGCPLRCTWCDTQYAYDGGERLTLAAVVARLRAFGCPLVEVTGGEPLAQPATLELLRLLADEFPTVLLETSGALPIADVDPRVVRIVDVKCPGSGMADRNHWPNLAALTPRDEIKCVLADRADYEWAVRALRERGVLHERDASCDCGALSAAVPAILFTPVHGRLDPVELARWVLADGLPVRFGLQLHKLIWPTATRGV